MNLAHRFIIALVVAALGIIFLPALWHRSFNSPERLSIAAKMPRAPSDPVVNIPELPATVKSQPDGGFKPLGYVVQVGRFARASYASMLVVKLRKMKLPAYSQPVQDDRKLVEVAVGPVSTEAQAKHILKQIDKQLRLEGMVKPFQAIELEK